MKPSRKGSASGPADKPRFAFAVATVCGIGYLKPGPGTWGSVAGVIVAIVSHPFSWFLLFGQAGALGVVGTAPLWTGGLGTWVLLGPPIATWLLLASLGVRSSRLVAEYERSADPQHVVIDEVSGLHLGLILGLAPLGLPSAISNPADRAAFALYTGLSLLNWKYLLAGFLLFRIFDIAKPFPCRRLEKLRGGWGIMADDWMAGVYAAICLHLALHFHVL